MSKTQKTKKRFSDEQIKSLEINYQSDSRPVLEAKQRLAEELGLDPRQVAIWFQNRRARSRTKQIERDYDMLKASYDNLVPKVESLKSENQALNNQLNDLKTHLGKQQGNANSELDRSGNCEKMKSLISHLLEDSENEIDGSLTSSMDWHSFGSSSYVDDSDCSLWWKFIDSSNEKDDES